jgi:peroxiredoxin
MTLLTASKACESSGLYSDAKGCLLTLEKDYGKTPFAEQAAGALRRYRLTGTVLEEFAGPTIDGAFLSIDQFRGQPVLIVFWSSESKNFREDLPRLRQAIADFGDSPLTILGVNLDQDEAIVDSALEQADLPWRTIFSTDPEQRGLRNPLARAYGVTTSPQYWVVDGDGKVLAAPTDLAGAEKSLATLH